MIVSKVYKREITEPYRRGDYWYVEYNGKRYTFTWETPAYKFYIEHGGKRK